MASQADTPETPLNGEQGSLPQINALAQYIKDLSAENPSAPHVFQWQSTPQLDVQFNLNVNRVSDEVHEVILRIELKANSQQGPHFLVDLTYAGLFGLRNVPEDQIEGFLVVEAPRLLFPFARRIIADATRDGGFPPLLLEPIDFNALFLQQAQAQGVSFGGEVGQA